MCMYTDAYRHIELQFLERCLSNNEYIKVIIDMKEQIWLPNKNISDCHVIGFSTLCKDTHACIISKVIGINEENKYIYQARKHKLSLM